MGLKIGLDHHISNQELLEDAQGGEGMYALAKSVPLWDERPTLDCYA